MHGNEPAKLYSMQYYTDVYNHVTEEIPCFMCNIQLVTTQVP